MTPLKKAVLHRFVAICFALFATHAYSGVKGDDDNWEHAIASHNSGVIPPQTKISGKSYGDWGAEWWKWALSVPFAQSPINDTTGQYGSQNQRGPVWFLAGTFGQFAERTIRIPAGKFIFFPLVNMWNDFPCPDPNFKPAEGQSMEEFLTIGVAPYIDPWLTEPDNTLSAKVDGVELKNLNLYRGISHLTKFKADPSQIAIDTCITGKNQVGVSDGFWIMLAPLSPGKHEIEFSAFADSNPFPFNLNVKYHVTITKHRD